MADDWVKWVKMSVSLLNEPEVIAMSCKLNRSGYAIVGMLHKTWSWAAIHTKGGHADVTKQWLDGHIGVEGFSDALEEAGWLLTDDSGIIFPDYDRYMSKESKKKLLGAKRSAKWRENNPKDATSKPAKNKADTTQSGFTFPVKGKAIEWPLSQSKLEQWQTAYPAVDVQSELARAKQWMLDNPMKKKTTRGMTKCLGGWLAKAAKSNGSNAQQTIAEATAWDRLPGVEVDE